MNKQRRRTLKQAALRLQGEVKALDLVFAEERFALTKKAPTDIVEYTKYPTLQEIGSIIGDVRSGIEEIYNLIGEENPDKND